MNRALFTVFILFYTLTASGQGHMVKIVQAGSYGFPTSSCLASDSSVVVVTSLYPFLKGLAVKFNQTGMIDWAKEVGSIDTTRNAFIHVVSELRQGILLAGSMDTMGYLLCLDNNGQKLWSRTIDIPGANSSQVTATAIVSDSQFVYVSYSDWIAQPTAGRILAKFDSMGGLIWCKQMLSGTIVKMVFNDALDQIAVICNLQCDGCFFSLDTSGAILDASIYPGIQFYDLDVFSDHSYIVAGRQCSNWGTVLTRVNENGNVLWSKKYVYPTSSLVESLTAIRVIDGFIYCANGSTSPVPGNVPSRLLSVDSNGVVKWVKTYAVPSISDNYIENILPSGNGELWLSGYFWGVGFEPFLIREDSSSSLSCISNLIAVSDSTIAIQDSTAIYSCASILPAVVAATDTLTDLLLAQYFLCPASSSDELSSSQQVNIYPNPATNELNISANFSEETVVRIYASNGQIVFEDRIAVGSIFYSTNLSLSDGVYCVVLSSEFEILDSQRLVIVH